MPYRPIAMGLAFAAAFAAAALTSPAIHAQESMEHDFATLLDYLSIPDRKISLQKMPIQVGGNETPGQHDCFWMGPVYAGAFNIAYPDGGAVYWGTVFSMPDDAPGAYLEIGGSFPQARYMSLTTYTEGAAPYDNIKDVDIVPDAGSENPYLSGTYGEAMGYTLRVVQGEAPQDRAPNTVYLGPADKVDRTPLLLRHYIPETGDDLTGGGGLPSVALVMPDGTRYEGVDACTALGSPATDSPDRVMFAPMMSQEDFDASMQDPVVAKNYLHTRNEDWNVFWDPRINIMAFMSPTLQDVMKIAAGHGYIPKTSGFYANLDNEYVAINVNEDFGDLVVLEARLPRTPATGNAMADPAGYDLRYWSLCTNESLVTTRFSACIYDEDVVLGNDRQYRIVVSKAANRPVNAREECGVTWLDWGDAGDGAGNPQFTSLVLRNMASNPAFGAAVQNIPGPGMEARTMGPYLPRPVYMSRASFESRGC